MGPGLPRPVELLRPPAELPVGGQARHDQLAGFCDPHVDALARQARAAQLIDPAAARRLWAEADRVVTDQAPYVPLHTIGVAGFVSSRVGNYQQSPVYGPLLDQMWVR